MKTIGTIKKSDIGRFRSMEGVRLHKRIKGVQDQVEGMRESFLKSDGSGDDYNRDRGMVLLERAKRPNTDGFAAQFSKTADVSGFLDNGAGELEAEITSSHSYYLGGRGGTHTFRTEMSRTESEDKIQWQVRQTNTLSAHPKGGLRTTMKVVENTAAGTLTLFEG